MIERKTWMQFKDTGMLWWINMILHTFGWAIVIVLKNEEIIDVYPARVKFRGFSDKNNAEGYIKVSDYMKENAEELLKEAND